jgi:hypothetical protein
MFWLTSLLTGLVTAAAIWWIHQRYSPWLKTAEAVLAQKEDIARLIELVESLKAQQTQSAAKDAERAKHPVEKQHSVSRIQFEAEFRMYQEVHALAHEVVSTHARIFPDESFMMAPAEETQKRFVNAQLKLTECLAKGEPFFEARVFDCYKLLEELVLNQKIAMLQSHAADRKNRKTDRKAIVLALQKCADVIRSRISTVVVLAP